MSGTPRIRGKVEAPSSFGTELSSSGIRVLHVVLEASEEEFPYNELCAARAASQEIGVCTFFPPKTAVPDSMRLFDGDGSVTGFLAALRHAHATDAYDLVHAHSPHVACLLLLLRATRRRFLPLVVTTHHSYSNRNLKARHRWMDLLAFAAFDRVVIVSEAARISFPAAFRRLAGRRLRVVPTAADVDRIDRSVRDLKPEADDLFQIVSVGRLLPIKNPRTVLKAFLHARSPGMHLSFVGEGELAETLRREVSEANASGLVRLTGLLPRDRVYEALARADLFVSASYGEGMPVAVLEAMACRCPVLLSDIPPHREIAVGVDFIPLVPPDDPVTLAEHMARFGRMPAAERRAIGERCRQMVESRYSLTEVHARYDAIYRELATPPVPSDGTGHHIRVPESV